MSNYWAYVHNPRSGEVHRVGMADLGAKGYRRLSVESCNLDDAGELDELDDEETAALTVAEGGSWCGHCCPQVEMVTVGDAAESATDNTA